MFGNLDDQFSPPASELRNFTNRLDEQAAFQRLLDLDAPQFPPVLMFHGVGGAGKTWLLRNLRRKVVEDMPTAHLDLDRSTGGIDYAHNSARALGEIRRQLGPRVACPRFDLAYTWLRVKEGAQDEPLFRGAGLLGNTWEFLVEFANAATSEIPGAGLFKWLILKATSPVSAWLKQSGVGKWLETELGEQDFLDLKKKLPQAIYPELHRRLLRDLREHLPQRDGSPKWGRKWGRVSFESIWRVVRPFTDLDGGFFWAACGLGDVTWIPVRGVLPSPAARPFRRKESQTGRSATMPSIRPPSRPE